MKKRILIIFIIVAIILIITGGIICLNIYQIKPTEKSTDEIFEIKRAKSEKLKEEHCLNNLCIEKLEVINQYDDVRVITGELINKSNKTEPAGYINLVFELKEEKVIHSIKYNDIEPNKSIPIEIHHHNDNLINITDYSIEKSTPAQIEELNKNISN